MGRAAKLKALRKAANYVVSRDINSEETLEGKSKVYAQIVVGENGEEPIVRERVERAKQVKSTGPKKLYKAYKRALKQGIIKVTK